MADKKRRFGVRVCVCVEQIGGGRRGRESKVAACANKNQSIGKK